MLKYLNRYNTDGTDSPPPFMLRCQTHGN